MTSATIRSHVADPDTRSFAQQKRAEKRAAAEEIGIDAAFIDHLVEAFYAKIREDGHHHASVCCLRACHRGANAGCFADIALGGRGLWYCYRLHSVCDELGSGAG